MEEAVDSSNFDHDHDDAVEEDRPALQEDQSPAVLQRATPMDAEETEEPGGAAANGFGTAREGQQAVQHRVPP